MRSFKKHLKNLTIEHFEGYDYIASYKTKVAKIDYINRTAQVLGYWSVTTTKHINYACEVLELTKIDQKK